MKAFIFCVLIIAGSLVLAQDTIYLSKSEPFAEVLGSATGSSALVLAKDVFLVAYNDGIITGGTIKLGRVQEDSIVAFVDSVDFAPSPGPGMISMSKLNESAFILSFTLNDRIYVRSGEIVDKSLILLGEIRKIESGAVSRFSQLAFSGNLFITAYYDRATEKGSCALGTIGEHLEIEIDSTYQFTDSGIPDTSLIAIDTLSKSSFVLSYGSSYGKSIIVSMDEDRALSFGTPFTFASNKVREINVLGLRENLFALVYDDEYEGKRRGVVILGRVDDAGIISHSEKYVFDEDWPSGISAIKLLRHEFMISYNGGWNDWHGYLVRARVAGDSVDFVNKVMFNSEPSLSSLSPMATFDGQDFMVIYLNRNTYRGFARLGSTIEFGRLSSFRNTSLPIFNIYPNPASHILHVQWASPGAIPAEVSLKVIDMSGRTVLSRKLETSRTTVELGDLQKGLYLLQLSDGKNVLTQKFIVN
ncbi:MAG: T9SS type A sorting domain-containing protein [Bacteroidota bacterium]